MKILKYRVNALLDRLPGRRQPLATPIPDAERRASEPQPIRASNIKVKALLIGIQLVREGAPTDAKKLRVWLKKRKARSNTLVGPHRDVAAMRKMLIDVYGYEDHNITVLIDDDDPNHTQPTRENILNAIADLIRGAQENDRFFFHYSGHSDQEDTDDISEEDSKNEFIITSDGKQIKDDELRANLAAPLPKGSSLIAVFDSCHSGTLLDLKHFRCNRVYVPWINKGARRTDSLRNYNTRAKAQISKGRTPSPVGRMPLRLAQWARTSIDAVLGSGDSASVVFSISQSRGGPSHSILTDVVEAPSSPKPWFDTDDDRATQCMSPVPLYCTGFCREDELLTYDEALPADVISISSSKDSQLTWEGEDGMSMTQVLVKIVTKAVKEENRHLTYQELMTLVSHAIHEYYIELHARARQYKKDVRTKNHHFIMKGLTPRPALPVEMDNFQDPQLSSDRPLDMSRHFFP